MDEIEKLAGIEAEKARAKYRREADVLLRDMKGPLTEELALETAADAASAIVCYDLKNRLHQAGIVRVYSTGLGKFVAPLLTEAIRLYLSVYGDPGRPGPQSCIIEPEYTDDEPEPEYPGDLICPSATEECRSVKCPHAVPHKKKDVWCQIPWFCPDIRRVVGACRVAPSEDA